jgi:uncharacterized membrane protein HdeD (DUF308 family)
MSQAKRTFPGDPSEGGSVPDVPRAEHRHYRSIATITLGVLSILLGIFAWGGAVVTTLASMLVLGVILLAAGVTQLVQAFRVGSWQGFFFHALIAAIDVAMGIVLLRTPYLGAASLTLLIAGYFIAGGVARMAGMSVIPSASRGWMLFSGLVSLLLGTWILWQWPTATLFLIGALIGIDLILTGWAMVMLGILEEGLRSQVPA